jgi:hypothetical protein
MTAYQGVVAGRSIPSKRPTKAAFPSPMLTGRFQGGIQSSSEQSKYPMRGRL